MSARQKPQTYRDMIDALVEMCHHGQGQIGAERVRKGVWNRNATLQSMPDQHQINALLARLSKEEREALAGMLVQEVELGVFETLKVLERFEVTPFEEGYEGSPYHDFIGRLADWKWPKT
jgi:hypothetical protein